MIKAIRNKTSKIMKVESPTPPEPATGDSKGEVKGEVKGELKDDFDINKNEFIANLPENIDWKHITFMRDFLNDAKKKRRMFSLKYFKSAIKP